MRAGRLNQRVELMQPVRTIDAEGGTVTAINSIGQAWAEVREMKPFEVARAQAMDAQCETIMTIRYRPDMAPLLGTSGNPQTAANVIGPTWFIRWNGIDWDISAAADPTGRRKEITLYVRRKSLARVA